MFPHRKLGGFFLSGGGFRKDHAGESGRSHNPPHARKKRKEGSIRDHRSLYKVAQSQVVAKSPCPVHKYAE